MVTANNEWIVVFLSYIIKLKTDSASISSNTYTTASIYPLSMNYQSSFSTFTKGALIVLSALWASNGVGSIMYLNIIDYDTLTTYNSIPFKSDQYKAPFSIGVTSSQRVFLFTLSNTTSIHLVSTDFNFCHTCSDSYFEEPSIINPTFVSAPTTMSKPLSTSDETPST